MSGKTGKEKTVNIRFRSLRVCLGIISAVFILDRLLKVWVEQSLDLHQSVPVIDRIFHLTLVHNIGAAFGLWRGARLFLIATTVLVLIVFVARLMTDSDEKMTMPQLVSWALVVGGASGNLYDRVRFGYVIDYLDLRVWPVFNLADSAICIGVFMLVVSQFRAAKK